MEIKYSQDFLNLYELIDKKVKKEKNTVKQRVRDIRYTEFGLLVLSLIILIISIAVKLDSSKLIFISVSIAMIIISILYLIINEIKIYGIKSKFKKEMMEEFAKEISDDWEYRPNDSISEVYYKKSGFNQTYKSIYSDGYLKAKRNNQTIDMGNISVIKDISRSNKNITVEAFNGIFARSKVDTNLFEIDIMRTNSKNNTKQKLEIVNGKLFMYSENIEKAQELLNNSLIQKVIDLRKELGIDIELMINEDEVFFRFFTPNMISSNVFASEAEKKSLFYYYRIIQFIIDFSNELENKAK